LKLALRLTKLEAGKAWMFFFGCLDIVSKQIEEEEKKQTISTKSLSDFFLPLRTRVIDALNSSNVLANVSDLFVEIPDDIFLIQ
jgi:hypothetical protein